MSGCGPALWLKKVPEPKITKNRVHICLYAGSLEDDIDRLIGLGAEKSEVVPVSRSEAQQ